MLRVFANVGGLRRVLLAVGILLTCVPAAGPRAQDKEYCFCITPRNNQAASGMSKAGNPSKVKIRWRGTNHMDMPAAGDTATAILTRLRAAVMAANPGDTVGPVTTDPMTGRAVFCVKGPAGGIGLPDARETDCNFKECTFSQISGPNDPFLRGVLGAFLAAEIPQGGNVLVSVDVQQPLGNRHTVTVQVQTNQPNLNQRVVAALNATGLSASLVPPYILIDRGAFAQVDGVGVVSNDLGIGTLEVGHGYPSTAIPTDFKIFPGAVTQFDQTCTSFTSRCALGAAGGEYLVEYPMNSKDVNGNATDFFRGIGEDTSPSNSVCQVVCVFYITQDQNCIDQESYSVILRGLNPTTMSGPDTNNVNAPLPPGVVTLQTPPNGPPSPCAWGIKVVFGAPIQVPCATSIFGGTSLANNPAWVANGQSQQGSWHQGGGAAVGDPVAAVASQLTWQINPAGVVSQCGTRRVNDFGVSVNCPTLNTANIHADPICPVNPACGHGGLYPSNTVRGDGVALCVRDANAPDGTGVFSLMSFSALPFSFRLVGILQKSLWIGPSPLIQISFGTSTTLAGQARDTRPFLAPGALAGSIGKLWFQSIVFYGGLPLPFTNAAATQLSLN